VSGIKYYALDENEEVPYEFVVTRDVNGEPEFCASFVNTNSLAYGNGVLLKLHERNDELRAENARLRSELDSVGTAAYMYGRSDLKAENAKLRTALSAVLQCNGITKRDKGCDACPMYDKEKEYVWAGDWCGIRQFIRELGIEVD